MAVQNRREPVPQNQLPNPRRSPDKCPGDESGDRPMQPDPPAVEPPVRPGSAGQAGKRADRPDTGTQGFCEGCPECGAGLSHESACVICHACGYSQCG